MILRGVEMTGKEKEERNEEEEEDFMSDKFIAQADAHDIVDAKKREKDASYGDLRRKQERLSREKARTLSRSERERQARQAGLARSLFDTGERDSDRTGKRKEHVDDDEEEGEKRAKRDRLSSEGGGSKALRMMIAMGFKPGFSLAGSGENDAADRPTGGAEMAVPVPIDERWIAFGQRSGIGRLPPSSAVALREDIGLASQRHRQATNDVLPSASEADVAHFRSRARQAHDQRHAESLVSTAQKTCTSLDKERLSMSYSPLWLTPNMLECRTEDLPEHERALVGFALEGLNVLLDEERTAKNSVKEPDDDDGETIEDRRDERRQDIVQRAREARQFCQLPTQARLDVILSHLRRAHSYCLFCGHAYDNAEQLAELCPGEQEEDH